MSQPLDQAISRGPIISSEHRALFTQDAPLAKEAPRALSRRALTSVSPQSGQSVYTAGPQLSAQDQGSEQRGAISLFYSNHLAGPLHVGVTIHS